MADEAEFSVESARAAARARRDSLAGSLDSWPARVATTLCWPISSLAELVWWAGPVELPIDQLHRLAGPAGDPVLCPVEDDYWDERVDALDTLVERGTDPAPVIVAYREGRLVLEDGNHRVEAVRRAGSHTAWAVVGFLDKRPRSSPVGVVTASGGGLTQSWSGKPIPPTPPGAPRVPPLLRRHFNHSSQSSYRARPGDPGSFPAATICPPWAENTWEGTRPIGHLPASSVDHGFRIGDRRRWVRLGLRLNGGWLRR